MSGGFRDEDDNFGDLLPPSTLSAYSSSAYAAQDELHDDLTANTFANPFADMESSRAVFDTHTHPVASPSIGSNSEDRFTRESAPEPETPSTYDFSNGFSATASLDALTQSHQTPLPPPEEQTPFGSPPSSPIRLPSALPQFSPPPVFPSSPRSPSISSATSGFGRSPPSSPIASRSIPTRPEHVRQQSSSLDLSDLLGKETPILPSFSRREPSVAENMFRDKPTSGIPPGKTVGKPLAALLGLEEEEKPAAAATPTPAPAPAVVEKKEEDLPATVEETIKTEPTPSTSATEPKPEVAPLATTSTAANLTPTPSTINPAEEQDQPTLPVVATLASAESIPLPPSPFSDSPPATATLSRASSFAPSSSSTSEAETEPSAAAYATVVSPLYTGDSANEKSWPSGSSSVVDALGGKLEALKTSEEPEEDEAEPKSNETSGTLPPASTSSAPATEESIPVPSTPPRHSSPPTVFTSASPQSPFGGEVHFSPVLTTSSSHAPDDPHFDAFASPTRGSRSLFDDPPLSPSPTMGRGFRSYNGGSLDDGSLGGRDDADSMRGTYSRSVEVEVEDDQSMETAMGRSSPGTITGDDGRSILSPMTSPPLPSVPTNTTPTKTTPDSASVKPTFVITVGDPQKIGSSLNVAAQHTVYTVRTQTTSSAFRKPEFSVLRRFSHFLWLFDALSLNNPGVIVPGMPEKNAIGRFGSEFVENRRSALQATLMKIVAHPMLVGDPDLRLFLESDSFSIDIKQRRIEAPAESKGFLASLGNSISGPKFQEFDEYFDTRRQILDTFEAQLKSLLASLSAAAKVRTAFQASLGELEAALAALATCDLSGPMKKSLEDAAKVQRRLQVLSEKQSESEEQIGGLTSVAEGYARLVGSVRLVFGARIKAYHAWQASESNLKKAKASHDKAKKTGRTHSDLLTLSLGEISDDGSLRLVFGNQAERKMLDAKEDFEDVSKLTKAEMARFDKEKVEDFKRAIEEYADGMVVRQREVVALWQDYHDALLKASGANNGPLQIEAPPAAPAPV